MSFEIPDRARKELEANPELAARLRDDAMDRVWRAADPEVQADARRAVRALSASRESFTSDDVWAEMTLHPSEPRMLGPVMRWAQTAGLVERTDRTILSTLPRNHRRPIRVWKALSGGRVGSGLGSTSDAVLPPEKRLTNHRAGFVCVHCRVPVDHRLQGPHKPDCEALLNDPGLYEENDA